MEPGVGVRVVLRDVETIEDLGVVTAPGPVEPGDLLASAEEVWRVEVVLVAASVARSSRCSRGG